MVVTTVSPMKRGLKVPFRWLCREGGARYNRFPDEKGTESRSYFGGQHGCSE